MKRPTDKEIKIVSNIYQENGMVKVEDLPKIIGVFSLKSQLQIPSDKDIEKESKISDSYDFQNGFEYGAKWLRSKLE